MLETFQKYQIGFLKSDQYVKRKYYLEKAILKQNFK